MSKSRIAIFASHIAKATEAEKRRETCPGKKRALSKINKMFCSVSDVSDIDDIEEFYCEMEDEADKIESDDSKSALAEESNYMITMRRYAKATYRWLKVNE